MNFSQPFRVRLPAWADWFALALMSLGAPLIAASIHSLCVFQRDFGLYNAEIGGAYFGGSGAVEQPGLLTVFEFLGACGIPAIPTFLVLLPFRKRVVHRWLVWAGFIVLWTWFFFKSEFAIR
jgi:hypothetical protein